MVKTTVTGSLSDSRYKVFGFGLGPLDERSEIELQVAEGERQNEMFPPNRPPKHQHNKNIGKYLDQNKKTIPNTKTEHYSEWLAFLQG
jgi:hypothetical protein